MSKPSQKKILLAVDGSERAMDAVRYVAKFPPFHNFRVMLFNVFSGVPESYRDMEKDALFSQASREVRSWEMQQRKVINEYMDQARQTLIRSGFPEKAISIKVQNRKKGIARDILVEARNRYQALVVGRKGMSTYKEIIIGSVADKLVDRASFLPVLIIGQIPPDENILIAVDASEGAMRAVDFVASTIGGFDFKIHLLHVIRGTGDLTDEFANLFFPKEAKNKAQEEITVAFEDAKKRLKDAGFTSDKITAKVITDSQSRAGSIIQEAREKDYGTIVVGRRGLSKVQKFFMGRVSNKVVHTVRNRAVWVIT